MNLCGRRNTHILVIDCVQFLIYLESDFDFSEVENKIVFSRCREHDRDPRGNRSYIFFLFNTIQL